MFRHQEKTASLKALNDHLDLIKRKILGLRWDDHASRRAWERDQRRISVLIAQRMATEAAPPQDAATP